MPDSSDIRDLLHASYNRDTWEPFLVSLFPEGSLTIFQQPQALAVSHEKVTGTLQLGTLTLPGDEQTIAILEVTTTDQVQLARNRVGLRNYVASFIDQAQASGVLAVFRQANSPDWRLTYASRTTTLDQDTFQITTIETAPKRYTFLLGENEPCRTAAARLVQLGEKSDDLALKDLELAFSVESLSKTFFDKYKEQYETFIAHLLSDDLAKGTRDLFEIKTHTNEKEQEKADKPVRDFVKTLLGRLVFLTFLQKKGWLGCPAGTRVWKGGQHDFLQQFLKLATENQEADLFHSKYLTALFFEALNQEDREGDLFSLTGTRLPYLNGGLFEDDDDNARSIDFPPQLFTDLLNFFDEYNFTIDENDPEDHEVGIDPEMLGMIFENLLEDNKEKGTYYTPKAIVSYMARQSLLHYLQTHLGENKALETLLNEKNSEALPSFVEENKARIIELLEKVTICDPAIGSGAFPIGLLHEILWTRLTLEDTEKNTPKFRAELKRAIIQNSIHGVDLDPGAIEIARLRFWLALVVDEDKPRPLPNLDYKIHRADSLIEYIRGEAVNLGTETPDDTRTKAAVAELIQAKQDLFTAQGLPGKRKAWFALYRALSLLAQAEFTWMRIETNFDDTEKLAFLTKGITDFGAWIQRIDAIQKEKVYHQEALLAKLRHWFDDEQHPTFLWNLHFGGIFADGGFDIVIANPPYERIQVIKKSDPIGAKLISENYKSAAKGNWDIYIPFTELCIRLLRNTGSGLLIQPTRWISTDYGERLREQIQQDQTLHGFVNFGDIQLFEGATNYVGIFHLRPKRAENTLYEKVISFTKSGGITNSVSEIFPANHFDKHPYCLPTGIDKNLLLKTMRAGSPLGSRCKITVGVQTSADHIYQLDCADELSGRLQMLKPLISGDEVSRWKANLDSKKIIFPYVVTDKKAVIVEFEQIVSDSPELASYLKKKETELRARENHKFDHDRWHQFGRSQNLAIQGDKKLCIPRLVTTPYGWIDQSGVVVLDNVDVGGIFPLGERGEQSLEFIQAIISSSTVGWLFPFLSVPFRGGFYSANKQFLGRVPIPPATDAEKAELATLAEKCAAAAAKDDQATLAIHEAEINQIVYRLFDLTSEEITLIESSLNS